MKFNKSWLDSLVNNDKSAQELADIITMAGLEVDSVESVAADFDKVVVGSVVECRDHEDSDHLHVTKIDIGAEEKLQIVCGAPNCREGLKVAVALVGATLPGFKIKEAKLRGVESFGMLCSMRELGMSEDHDGILELPLDAPLGMDLREYMDLNDHIIDVDLTSNRPDCLSLRGIARECAVLLESEFKDQFDTDVAITCDEIFKVYVEAKEGCPRYLSRVVKNVNQKAKSPLWMTERLRRAGIRAVSPIVDVTNYVMLELGQPLHSFDYDRIHDRIIVRMAKPGEKLVLLSGVEQELKEDTLIIADSHGPIALAGIFGGLESGINDETTNVVLESAFFSPSVIKGRARSYGLNTDASHRFERGVDSNLQRLAMDRVTKLLVDIAGGEVGEIVEVVAEEYLPKSNEIVLRPERMNKILGAYIAADKAFNIMAKLGFNPRCQGTEIKATSPSFRFDLEREEDLIEEIARIYGYNNIENKAPVSTLYMPSLHESSLELLRLKQLLVSRSYQEAITYSFTDPKVLQSMHAIKPLLLEAPISSEMAAMRTTITAGLLMAAKYNANRQQKRIRLFESGLCYIEDSQAENGIRQDEMLAGLIMGDSHDEIYGLEKRSIDYFDIKGDVEVLLAATAKAQDFSFVATTSPFLHPGQGADIVLDGKVVGFVGMLHPVVQKDLGIKGTVAIFEIQRQALATRKVPVYKEISKFPSIRRDFALVVDKSIAASDIVKAIYNFDNKVIEVKIFDVFESEQLGDKRSIALAVILQDNDKTLEDKDIESLSQGLISVFEDKFEAKLRS